MTVQYQNLSPDCDKSEQASDEKFAPRDKAVLVVDDNDEVRSLLKQMLHESGYSVRDVNRAEAALQSIVDAVPDIILCDVMMPDKNGYDFYHDIHQNPDWAQIPFIFLTSLAGREDINHGKSLGCDDYITKPFDPAELLAVVQGKIALSEKRKHLTNAQFENYRRRIIHTLSHEFRTPLVSINTGTELLLDQHRQLNADQTQRLLESIHRGGNRLEKLVNDFMLLQQIDLGHAQSSCERFRRKLSLQYLVESAIESFQENLPKGQRGVEVVFSAEGECTENIAANIYDVQIAHVIQHLLSNALKFGGPDKPIEVSLCTRGESVIVRVRDFGPGLDSRMFQKACELFAQIDRERAEQQGAGVGLTIAQYFTKINDGVLEFAAPADGSSGLIAELKFPVFGE